MYSIHYSCYIHIGYVWRGIKTNPRPKTSTAPGPRPPVLKFLDPPLETPCPRSLQHYTITILQSCTSIRYMHKITVQKGIQHWSLSIFNVCITYFSWNQYVIFQHPTDDKCEARGEKLSVKSKTKIYQITTGMFTKPSLGELKLLIQLPNDKFSKDIQSLKILYGRKQRSAFEKNSSFKIIKLS